MAGAPQGAIKYATEILRIIVELGYQRCLIQNLAENRYQIHEEHNRKRANRITDKTATQNN